MASFFHDVAHKWKGAGMLYLLLLAAVTSAPLAVNFHKIVNKFAIEEVYPIIDKIPDIQINKGEVKIDKPQPYFLSTNKGEIIGVIDTTGKITSLEDGKYKFLVTKNSFIYKQDANETRIFNLRDIDGFSVTNEQVKSWADKFAKLTGFIAYPFIMPFIYMWRIIQALIYGLIGMAIASIVKVKLTYAALMRLSAVSLTPMALAGSALIILGNLVTIPNIASIIITIMILFIACKFSGEENTGSQELIK